MTNPNRAAEALRARFRRQVDALRAEGYVTIADAALALGVDRHTVTRMIADGRLHATRVDDRTVTRREWISEPRTRKTAAQWRREHGWLSVAEAAKMLGITRQALNVRIQRGQQSAVRAGDGTPVPGAWLIRAEDVLQRPAA